jgi:simple sugar transport system permease protein
MTSTTSSIAKTPGTPRQGLQRLLDVISMPLLAMPTAFFIGAIIIFATTGSLSTVLKAYGGMFVGAFTKQRAFSESLVATIPYILLSLGLAVGFKSGLFNIGVEGQFSIGAVSAAFVGALFHNLPAIIHLPLTLGAGALGGAIWAAIPGYLKAKTGAHEVINTIMMNYIAFRLTEYLVSYPLLDRGGSSAVQTRHVSSAAELWTMSSIPTRLQDPLNAIFAGLVIGLMAAFITHVIISSRGTTKSGSGRRWVWGIGAGFFLFTSLALPFISKIWWPFTDQYDRLHIGLILALFMSVFVYWLLWKTTMGFELRMVGANPNAARYSGINITKNIVLAMAISGALAGLAGTIEVLGVSACRCLPLSFSSGYGFDSIAIALLAKNSPFGILGAAFLFGAMRNGADLMELRSGVSKYIISLIQALALLFVAAPAIVRTIYRMKARKTDEVTIVTHGWGGS